MNDQKIDVLDKGFVRLEGFLGGDEAVVRSARVSYGSSSSDPEKDQKLIAYLLANGHGSPFEHAVFQFHVKLPIFVARQWIRHRMASYNEISARYTEVKDEFYFPSKWRAQDSKNKQGSVEADLNHEHMMKRLEMDCQWAMKAYNWYLEKGAAKEMARMVLPVNTYTQWYWTVNARALIHFLDLRCDSHAQWETRQYAHACAWFMKEKMPWTFEAWVKSIPENKQPGYSEMYSRLNDLTDIKLTTLQPRGSEAKG